MLDALHQRVRFELPELLGEHLLGDVRDQPSQLSVPEHAALLEVPQDQRLPSSADQVERDLARLAALNGRTVPTTAIIVGTLAEDWLVELEIVAAG